MKAFALLLVLAALCAAEEGGNRKKRQFHSSLFEHPYHHMMRQNMYYTQPQRYNTYTKVSPAMPFGYGSYRAPSYGPGYGMTPAFGHGLSARQVFNAELNHAIQVALESANIVIPEGHVIVLSGKQPAAQASTGNTIPHQTHPDPIGQQGIVSHSHGGITHAHAGGAMAHAHTPSVQGSQMVNNGLTGHSPDDIEKPNLSEHIPGVGQNGPSTVLASANLPPVPVIPDLPGAKPFSNTIFYVKPGTVVTPLSTSANSNPLSGRDPAACTPSSISQCKACGIVNHDQEGCIEPFTVAGAQFVQTANEVFQSGIHQLSAQLGTGSGPNRNIIRDESDYYWVYTIYYHVSDRSARLWMGHVQLYMAAYDWTLGLYYAIDPNGDLRLVYYSATPEDGYVAEEAIWPQFTPYEWMDEEPSRAQLLPSFARYPSQQAKFNLNKH